VLRFGLVDPAEVNFFSLFECRLFIISIYLFIYLFHIVILERGVTHLLSPAQQQRKFRIIVAFSPLFQIS